MSSHPRLGRGIGTLFPALPVDDEADKKKAGAAPVTPVESADKTAEGAERASNSNVSRETDVSRETSAAAQPAQADGATAETTAEATTETTTETTAKKEPGEATESALNSNADTTSEAGKSSEAEASDGNQAAESSENSSAPASTDALQGSESEKNASAEKNAGNKSASHSGGHRNNRPHIPSLIDSLHPADLFFSDTTSEKPKESTPQTNGETPSARTENPRENTAAPTVVASRASESRQPTTDTAASTDAAQSESSAAPISGAYYTELRLDEILPNEHQPRTIFDEDELHELAESIKEVGVLEPIVVRPRHNWKAPYELIMGERRMRAAKAAGLERIPAIVRTTADENMLRDAVLENLHRVALNPLEEAAAYEQMLEDFHITQAQLAKSVSKSRSQITNTLRLLQLPGSVQKKVAAGVLSAGHARALLALTDESQMEPLAERIIGEGLSVRSTEEIVALKNGAERKQHRRKKQSVWSDSPALQNLENRFETKVEIHGSKEKGKIEITFSSEEDFDRIMQLMNGADQARATNDGWV